MPAALRFTALMRSVLFAIAMALPLSAAQTDTRGIHAVPAPGAVVIDGELGDWDLSGSYLQCYDVVELRDVYSARVAMMYDAQALYVAIRWVDRVPLGNCHDPRFSASKGWAGDSVQLRIKTDRICHVTGWCYAPTQEPCLQIDYGKSLTEPFDGGSRLLRRREGWKLDDGAEMAFRVDADHQGYVQEIRLPWALITTGKALAAGGQFACGIELLWGETDWPLHRYADNLAPGAASREFFWTAHQSWGPVWLEQHGGLTLPEPSWTALLHPAPAEGPVEVRYDLPRDARVTVAIDDAAGKRVRNLIACEPRRAGANVERWDGLDDDGQPVPAGAYRLRGLHLQGIHASYVMSFANPGDPSWSTPDGHGAFYGDHTAATGVATGGEPGHEMVALACPGAEAGPHLIGCDLNGRRRWGLANRDSEFGVHTALATDGRILWVAQEDRRSFVYRVDLVTGRYAAWERKDAAGQPILDLLVSEQPGARVGGAAINLRGIAWHAGEIAVCLEREGLVRILDGGTGDVTRSVAVPGARGITHAGGHWIVLAGDRLLRLGAGGAVPFGEAQWGDAYALASDPADEVLVSRRGCDHDVAVTDGEGRIVRTIGRHGGRPLSGAFDEQGMRNPAQLAVDRLGRVWVAEATDNPKRTSVWGAGGGLALQLNGTTGYAAAGAINPYDPAMGFTSNAVFRIDLERGTWTPTWSFAPSGVPGDLFPPLVQSRARVVVHAGATYLYAPGSTASEHCASHTNVAMMRDGIWRAAAHVATVTRKEGGPFADALFATHEGQACAWADANGDGLVQADELVFADYALRERYWGHLPTTDGTLVYADEKRNALIVLPIAGWTACGAPRYDIAHPRVVPVAGFGVDCQLEMICGGAGNRVYLNMKPLTGFDLDGKLLFTYPSRHLSVHGSHTATAARPGYLIGPNAVLGTAEVGGAAGEIFSVNGNLGENYLFTWDGLWVQALFKDTRGDFDTPLSAARGMDMDHITAGGESFGGHLTRTVAGQVLLTLGATDARVLELTGFEAIARFGGAIAVSDDQVVAARALRDRRLPLPAVPRTARIPHRTGIVCDGKGDDWPQLDDGLAIGDDHARVGLAWDEHDLHVAWRVKAAAPMRNVGQDPRLLFKSGDCVDLMLAGATNLRLLVAPLDGRPVAVLYEQSVPGTPAAARAGFSSPARTIFFDRAAPLAAAQVAAAPCP
ncbi:MAG: hypothetical protein H0X38_01105, partial [Planctomycetes bacterium]|nr:hypothetical protein [Planctomycetota bacterium]